MREHKHNYNPEIILATCKCGKMVGVPLDKETKDSITITNENTKPLQRNRRK